MIRETPIDSWLLSVTLLLVLFGALMIYSTTSVVAPEAGKGVSQFHYFKRHLFTVLFGLGMMAGATKVKPWQVMKLAVPLLVLSLVLLVLVFVPGIGVSANNARRWIRLWPSTFQPSELVKLSMVVFLAWYLSIKDLEAGRFVDFAVPVGVMLVFQGIFLLQPDFGATMSLGVLTLGMLFVAGVRLRYVAGLVLLAVPVVIKLVIDEPYRLKRVTAFLNPWEHARDSGFQLVQSFIAFGSGGLTGVGLGNGRQKLSYLPEVHTDFIFPIVGEELGFIAAVAVVAAFCFLFLRGVLIAGRNSDPFAHYMAFGLSIMIAGQALVNFFVVTGLVPTKGLPLPFVSYGGSSLLVNMTAVGMLLALSSPREKRLKRGKNRLDEAVKRKKAKRNVYKGGR